MKRAMVMDFIADLQVTLPPVERFFQLGDLTALRRRGDGTCYRANYERGLLLYALVARHRPAAVLEFGTGRGYGALCMAWAMEDAGIPGVVYSVDLVAHNEPFEWLLDRGAGPVTEYVSRNDLWVSAVPTAWRARVRPLAGWSGEVMRAWRGPRIDLAYIDGGHALSDVRHDFYACLDVRSERLQILFDDYNPNEPAFGVHHLVDTEVSPRFPAVLVHTDGCWAGGAKGRPDHGMAWVNLGAAVAVVDAVFPPSTRASTARTYRRMERVRRIRHRLGRLVRRVNST